ncbi:hypothetical protein RFN29_35120 [Mesorhizobium sp. VK22B]|uniref:Uncharacterized protein n=1 Tax=Mesorhizobium captivum TaxID=3072319 RepID=A0ABU4ZFF5_9HYPH|nr:hypothetical protein [Mesorhizobium sp. VK22B]MDX8496719.1 hypothetical protein [Mesorhizobium sp. VK22B]
MGVENQTAAGNMSGSKQLIAFDAQSFPSLTTHVPLAKGAGTAFAG